VLHHQVSGQLVGLVRCLSGDSSCQLPFAKLASISEHLKRLGAGRCRKSTQQNQLKDCSHDILRPIALFLLQVRPRIGDLAAAEGRLRAALDADRESGEAHSQLVDLLRASGRQSTLVAALRAWSEVEFDEDARKERLREAARLAESLLGDIGLAAAEGHVRI